MTTSTIAQNIQIGEEVSFCCAISDSRIMSQLAHILLAALMTCRENELGRYFACPYFLFHVLDLCCCCCCANSVVPSCCLLLMDRILRQKIESERICSVATRFLTHFSAEYQSGERKKNPPDVHRNCSTAPRKNFSLSLVHESVTRIEFLQ